MPRAKPEPCPVYPQWSRAKFWAFIRSGLRAKWSRWPPRFEVLAAAKRPYVGDNKNQKWEYQCSVCKQYHLQKNVEVDHMISAGSLKSWEDLPGFAERLFCEVDKLRVVCKPCHKLITNNNKNKDKE